MDPATAYAASAVAGALPSLINRGNSSQNKATNWQNQRAFTTNYNIDQRNFAYQQQQDNIGNQQWQQTYDYATQQNKKLFDRQAAESDRDYYRRIEEFNANRTDSNAQYAASMDWSREQYNRMEAERARYIQDRVADANKAGIHPLYALGASANVSGGTSIPTGGSGGMGAGTGSGYGSTAAPSPVAGGGVSSPGVADAGLAAVRSGSRNVDRVRALTSAFERFHTLSRQAKQDTLNAALVSQQISESRSRQRLNEVESQVQNSGERRAVQRVNHTGIGRGKAPQETVKTKPSKRAEDLVDKQTWTGPFGEKYNTINAGLGIKLRYPESADTGDAASALGGEPGEIITGIGAITQGIMADSIKKLQYFNEMVGLTQKVIMKAFK